MRNYRLPGAVVAACLLAAIVGYAWPRTADTLLRLLPAALATGLLVLLIRRLTAALPKPSSHSPYDYRAWSRTASPLPRQLTRLTSELTGASSRQIGTAEIPFSVRSAVRTELRHRLADHHGLVLDDPKHAPRIQAMVHSATWRLGKPRPPVPERQRYRPLPAVPLHQLGQILDDLERL
ncbi:MAG: hypothetical protein ACRDT6_27625 [Micromonosporaceae bacterium]